MKTAPQSRTSETIAFACLNTCYGAAVAAASPRGLCLLEFGVEASAAQAELKRCRGGEIVFAGDGELERMVSEALSGCAIPTDPTGTAFQMQVWEALQGIPPGTVASYSEVARWLGRPDAARAVAMACAANRIAVLIPCHRVVRADGSLSGYRWGADLKRSLLAVEAAGR